MNESRATARLCASCGSYVDRTEGVCAYCGGQLGKGEQADPGVNRSVQEAAAIWARNVFGAPRRFADLVTRVEVRDEVLERVVTEVVRRDLREQRAATTRRQASTPKSRADAIDLFAVSPESLRAETEHVAACSACQGSSLENCLTCTSTGRATCANCGGLGKFRNPSTNRLNKCKACRASGLVECEVCDGKGSVPCRLCGGSGHQLVWLVYDQRSSWRVAVEPEGPILRAHPQLREARSLVAADIAAFSVVREEQANIAVSLKDSPLLAKVLGSLDRRYERVARQQYLKLAIVRRDTHYAMCGDTGTVVLSGKDLVGSLTKEALGPIRLRLWLWLFALVVVGVGVGLVANTFSGQSAYFKTSGSLLWISWLLAVVAAVPALGGVFRRWPLRAYEKVAGVVALLAVVAVVLIGRWARPTEAEVREALEKGDIAGARLVIDALVERQGGETNIRKLEDEVLMAEANTDGEDERIRLLDTVASHNGPRAAEALAQARSLRLAKVRRLIKEGRPDEALKLIDVAFAEAWKKDPEIAEERARSFDAAFERCQDDPCRLTAAKQAKESATNDLRMGRLEEARKKILDALAVRDVPGEDTLIRLRRLSGLATLAKSVSAVAKEDLEISAQVKEAEDWVSTERAKVPFLGNAPGVAAELFGVTVTPKEAIATLQLEHLSVFLVFDSKQLCRGLYTVGAVEGARGIKGETWTAERILSQAIGRSATIQPAIKGKTASQWSEQGTPVVARWLEGELVELRIGDAKP